MPFINDQVNQNTAQLSKRQYKQAAARVSRFRFNPEEVMSNLQQRIVGQPRVLDAIQDVIYTVKADFGDKHRPLSVMLFMGPTGVGKTELTKALAGYMFDTESAMVRIDMSEFMEKHSVARLVGAPPGYVGYEEGGYLTEAVRRKPYSVILLDEIEKAHPDVFNILLQVLDDGRLTDGQGRTVDFKNTVIIMTSNLGSDIIQEQSGSNDYDELKAKVMGVLHNEFRPEFINRIDETVVFHPLAQAHIENIAKIQLQRLERRLQDNGYQLELTNAALAKIAEAGFDPVFGARPLKRAIQQTIENPLAQRLLGGDYQPGAIIHIDADENGLVFSSR